MLTVKSPRSTLSTISHFRFDLVRFMIVSIRAYTRLPCPYNSVWDFGCHHISKLSKPAQPLLYMRF